MIFKAECVLLFNAGVLFAIIDNEFFLWAEQIRRDSVNFIHSALERLFNISLKSSSFVSIDIELESILLSFRIVICNGKHDIHQPASKSFAAIHLEDSDSYLSQQVCFLLPQL